MRPGRGCRARPPREVPGARPRAAGGPSCCSCDRRSIRPSRPLPPPPRWSAGAARALESLATPPPAAPPPPRVPLGVRLAARPRESQVRARGPPPRARWSSLTAAVEPGKPGSMTASGGAALEVAPPAFRKLISPPSPRSASSGFGEGQSTAGNFLRCHHTVRPHPGCSGWRWRLPGRGAPRSSGVLQRFCVVQSRGSSPLQEG